MGSAGPYAELQDQEAFPFSRKMHYYQFHIGDFRSATSHLTNSEELAYRRALDWYYHSESPIPLDTQWVSRRLRVEAADLESVLKDFFVLTDSGWEHKRCEQEISNYRRMKDKNRTNGLKGGRPPSKGKPKNNPMGSEAVASGNPNQEPITNNQEPKTKNQKRIHSAIAPPDGVSAEVWEDFCSVRKGKRSKITKTAIDLIVREAGKASWTVEQALAECCARGWSSFKAQWVEERRGANGARASPETFRERDARVAAARVAQFAPGIAEKKHVAFTEFLEEVKNVDFNQSH